MRCAGGGNVCIGRAPHGGGLGDGNRRAALSAAALAEPRHFDHVVQQPRGREVREGVPVVADGADQVRRFREPRRQRRVPRLDAVVHPGRRPLHGRARHKRLGQPRAAGHAGGLREQHRERNLRRDVPQGNRQAPRDEPEGEDHPLHAARATDSAATCRTAATRGRRSATASPAIS